MCLLIIPMLNQVLLLLLKDGLDFQYIWLPQVLTDKLKFSYITSLHSNKSLFIIHSSFVAYQFGFSKKYYNCNRKQNKTRNKKLSFPWKNCSSNMSNSTDSPLIIFLMSDFVFISSVNICTIAIEYNVQTMGYIAQWLNCRNWVSSVPI